jgi:hypothetical protein
MSFSSFVTDTVGAWWSPVGLIQVVPGDEWKFRWVYVALIAVCFLVALVVTFLKIRLSLKSRIQVFGWTNVFIGVILYFCRDQHIPYLGMDLLRFLQELGMVFWINGLILFSKKGLKAELLAEQVQARKAKYLPQKPA